MCSFGRIINIYLDEFCTRHVNVHKYVYLVYAELLWKLMLYNYLSLRNILNILTTERSYVLIWESFKENGKLTTIISDLTEKLQEIQQNANNKKDRDIYNQMCWTEYLTDTHLPPPPHLIRCLTDIQFRKIIKKQNNYQDN